MVPTVVAESVRSVGATDGGCCGGRLVGEGIMMDVVETNEEDITVEVLCPTCDDGTEKKKEKEKGT